MSTGPWKTPYVPSLAGRHIKSYAKSERFAQKLRKRVARETPRPKPFAPKIIRRRGDTTTILRAGGDSRATTWPDQHGLPSPCRSGDSTQDPGRDRSRMRLEHRHQEAVRGTTAGSSKASAAQNDQT